MNIGVGDKVVFYTAAGPFPVAIEAINDDHYKVVGLVNENTGIIMKSSIVAIFELPDNPEAPTHRHDGGRILKVH